MPSLDYKSFIENFSVANIEAALLGDCASGFSVYSELCGRYAHNTKSNNVALRHQGPDGTVTDYLYEELDRCSAQFANYLNSLGIGRGDRVGCLLPRTPELFVVVLGTLRAGAVYQPMFTAFGPGAIEYRTEKASTKLIVTDETHRPKLDDVSNCPPILLVAANETPGNHAIFTDVLNAQAIDFEPVVIGAKDPFLQMFTSGTVGTTQLGYGLGLAMGAKLARPEALCINVWGDAAIGFTGMDFETAVRERIPILSILFNNFSMAIELPIMQVATEKYRSTDISGHYADMAKAFGGYGERVEDPNDIQAAIKRGIEATQKGQPALLEFITSQELAISTF